MLVYRLTKTLYAEDMSGTGAKLYGGRWNQVDTACIYTASSRALAVLEYSVNVELNLIPKSLSMCVFSIDESQIHRLKKEHLPSDWNQTPAPFSTKEMGTKLLLENKKIIQVPSLVIPHEFNFILHPSFAADAFQLEEIEGFQFDLRIKK